MFTELDKQKSTNQLKCEAKGHTLYPRKMRKTVGNDNGQTMRYIQLTIVEFGARRPFKLELSARDPGLRVTLVRVTAYDQFGLYRWRTAHSEVTFAQVLVTTTILCCFKFKCNCKRAQISSFVSWHLQVVIANLNLS